jgi:hypothetical protein
MRTNAAVALVLFAGMSAQAAAQIVTPAPAPKPKEEYTPPPPPAPRPAARPAAEPAQPEFDPSTVEFEPIYTRTDDGEIVPVHPVVEVAAIMNNPLVDEDIRIVIDELIKERQSRAETIIRSNPRDAVAFGAGVVDRMDFANRATVEEVAAVAQNLQMGDGVIVDLAKQGVLTDQARMMSLHIWQDYNQAKTAALAEKYAEAEDPNALLNEQSRFLMNVSMQEIAQAFDRVARSALGELDSPEAEAALKLDGIEFRREAAAILGRLDDDRLDEVMHAGA